tara:strand:+ start:2985 stop:5837 length:2853 start_codon:yes stop_codon:yes gene_type:complete
MLLKDFIPKINKKYKKISFSGISFDSSKVKRNDIFFAFKGKRSDGHDFIDSAIKKGAKIIISEKEILLKRKHISYLKFSNARKLLAQIAFKISGKKPEKLVAVTGTNGKSSVSNFYYQILKNNSKKVASIGTIGISFKEKKKLLINTTLDPISLGKILDNLKKEKIEYVIMEASSHGLHQNRLDGLLFDIGIFTNLSHDHLDYHKTTKNYLNSKLYLFNELIKKRGSIISDFKIPQIKEIKKISYKKKINLCLIHNKKKGIDLISHNFENEKQVLEIGYKKKKYTFKIDLIGKIQIKNLLMAILAASKSGIKFEKIIKVLSRIKPVEGRLEKIGKIKNNSKVILDYAHTPAALEIALSNLKEQFPESNINLVFGCGGNRDFKKRSKMGNIASRLANKIYLTDDNPREEDPSKIRKDIKKGVKKNKVYEIANRKKAIHEAVLSLKSGDVLLVAGKGHEKTQDYGNKKLFFSDKEIILNSIKLKNKHLSNNIKINILEDLSNKKFPKNLKIRNISIDSKSLKKNDIFFAIKGKKNDGNNFIAEVFKKKSSLAIVNKIKDGFSSEKQIKVKDTLKFLTKFSSIYRINLDTKIISITGSCGKTTLKEMLTFAMKKLFKTTSSPRSFNNKFGVPLSLLNLKQSDDFGILEVGMDKKGEIDNLTKTIKPNVGIITNISYAHSKNFKNIKEIAKAKAEIMNHIKKNGTVILNADDDFFEFHKNLAFQKNLNVRSFGIKNKFSDIKFIKSFKKDKRYEMLVKGNGKIFSFYSKNLNKNNIYNILASLTAISLFCDIEILKKELFINFQIPKGRGDISKVKIKDKEFFLIDESYNSNPLSLKTAIENYDNIDAKSSKKYLILGDMLELGQHSVKQHDLMSETINKTKIFKVDVVGNYIKKTFARIKKNKKGKILKNKNRIFDTINENLKNNDYLMIKGSNSTGLNKVVSKLKQKGSYAI